MTPNPAVKRCRTCGAVKHLNAFSKDRSRKDEHASVCRSCKGETNRTEYQQRKDETVSRSPDKFVCYLDHAKQHRLVYDAQQWIPQKVTGKGWRNLCYVGSNCETLLRAMAAKGIIVTDEVREEISKWGRFLDWRKTYSPPSHLEGTQDALRAA